MRWLREFRSKWVPVAAAGMVLAAAAAAARAETPPQFVPLGDLQGGAFASFAFGVSGNGQVVVGMGTPSSGSAAFRATSQGMFVVSGGSGNATLSAWGASKDGSIIVGRVLSAAGNGAFRWQLNVGATVLGDLPGGTYDAIAYGVSADGSVVVGQGRSASGTEAFRWTSAGGMVGLGDLFGGIFDSRAWDVSADGTTAVGSAASAEGTVAVRWVGTGAAQSLDYLPGLISPRFSSAQGVNRDGSVIVGYSTSVFGYEAFRWTQFTGMVPLGVIPGYENSYALATSGDGNVIVGYCDSALVQSTAMVWSPAFGIEPLYDRLVAQGVTNLAGWTLLSATGVSSDGRVIVGTGIDPMGQSQAWKVVYPACLADFDGIDGITVTDLFLFLDAWFAQFGQLQQPLPAPLLTADVVRDGVVDVTDLFEFLDKWFDGCGV